MNLSQLEHLVEFARTGNRLTAAENSFVTPQAISKSIANLSSELGVALSRKAGRDVEPTEAALKIVPFAESALQSISDMKSQAYRLTRVVAREGDVKIALSFTAFRGYPVEKDAFDRFTLTHPDISVHIETYQNETCLLALYGGIVDAVIAMGKPINPDLECREVALPVPVVAIVPTVHPRSPYVRRSRQGNRCNPQRLAPWILFPSLVNVRKGALP